MHAGRLRYYGTIKRRTYSASSTGAPTEGTPATVANVRFDFATEPGTATGRSYQMGGEPYAANRDFSQLHHTLTFRYRAGIIPTMFIDVDTGPLAARRLEFLSIEVVAPGAKGEMPGQRRWLRVYCKEQGTAATP